MPNPLIRTLPEIVDFATGKVVGWLDANGNEQLLADSTSGLTAEQIANLASVEAEPVSKPTGASWQIVPDGDLYIAAGGALDFSGHLATAVPAGSNGLVRVMAGTDKLEEANNPGVAVRFNAWTWDTATYTVPSTYTGETGKAAARDAAANLRRKGYNAVRVHGVENWLQSGRAGVANLDPDKLDFFLYFLAQCKTQGIYWIFNPMSYRLYEDTSPDLTSSARYTYTDATNCKQRMFCSQNVRDNWETGFAAIYNVVNPYTGLKLCLDPALLMFEFYNESTPAYLWNAKNGWPSTWSARPGTDVRTNGNGSAAKNFVEWLSDSALSGYADVAAINTAWGTAYADTTAAGTTGLSSLTSMTSGAPNYQRFIDIVRWLEYAVDDTANFYAAMKTKYGMTCLTCWYNISVSMDYHRAVGKHAVNSVSNSHGYADELLTFTAGTTIQEQKPIWNTLNWSGVTASAGEGKPSWYGEHGWPAFDIYRSQYPVHIAFGLANGASGFTRFSTPNVFARYLSASTDDRHRRVYLYNGAPDMPQRFADVLMSLLINRGEITPRPSVDYTVVLNERSLGTNPRNPSRYNEFAFPYFGALQGLAYTSKLRFSWSDVDNTTDTLHATIYNSDWFQILGLAGVTAGNPAYDSAYVNRGTITAVATTGTFGAYTATQTNPVLTLVSSASGTPALTLADDDYIAITNITGSVGTWPGNGYKHSRVKVKFTGVAGKYYMQSSIGLAPNSLNASGLDGTNFTAGTWCEFPGNVVQHRGNQVYMSSRTKRAWIATGKTVAVFFGDTVSSINANALTVSDITPDSSVFVSSLDGLPLTTSKKMLVGLVSDAQNFGQTFASAARLTMNAPGDYPAMVKTAFASLKIARTSMTRATITPLDHTGAKAAVGRAIGSDEAGYVFNVQTWQGRIFWLIEAA